MTDYVVLHGSEYFSSEKKVPSRVARQKKKAVTRRDAIEIQIDFFPTSTTILVVVEPQTSTTPDERKTLSRPGGLWKSRIHRRRSNLSFDNMKQKRSLTGIEKKKTTKKMPSRPLALALLLLSVSAAAVVSAQQTASNPVPPLNSDFLITPSPILQPWNAPNVSALEGSSSAVGVSVARLT